MPGPLQAVNMHFRNLEMDNEVFDPAKNEHFAKMWKKMTVKQRKEWNKAMEQTPEGRTLRENTQID